MWFGFCCFVFGWVFWSIEGGGVLFVCWFVWVLVFVFLFGGGVGVLCCVCVGVVVGCGCVFFVFFGRLLLFGVWLGWVVGVCGLLV